MHTADWCVELWHYFYTVDNVVPQLQITQSKQVAVQHQNACLTVHCYFFNKNIKINKSKNNYNQRMGELKKIKIPDIIDTVKYLV